MNTQQESAPLSDAENEELAGKLATLIQAADKMVSHTLATAVVLGGSPISLSAKMLVAGILSEIVTHPHESYDELKKELVGITESIVESIQMIDESQSGARKAIRSLGMRDDMRAVIKPKSE